MVVLLKELELGTRMGFQARERGRDFYLLLVMKLEICVLCLGVTILRFKRLHIVMCLKLRFSLC